jgi:hypothetical protein
MAVNASTERGSRKRIKSRVGDIFAIDLAGGSWGLGHIVAGGGADTCHVLFANYAASVEDLRTLLDQAMLDPVGMVVSNDTEIRRGTWPIVGHREPQYPGIVFPKLGMGGGTTWHSPAALPEFIEAYHGLRPWDEAPISVVWNREILLPHLPIPATARFRGGSPAPVPPPTVKPPPVTEGPALVTIQLVYPGSGYPSTDLVRKRQEMERRLEAAGAGEVEGAESGAGVMEVYLRTDDVRRAVPLVEQIAGELGFKDDLLIETAPLEDDEGEDEEAEDG